MLPDEIATRNVRLQNPLPEASHWRVRAFAAPLRRPREPFWGYMDLALVVGLLFASDGV